MAFDDTGFYRCPACASSEFVREDDTLTCGSCATSYGLVAGVESFYCHTGDQGLIERYERDASHGKLDAHTVGYLSEKNHTTMKTAIGRAMGEDTAGLNILDVGCGHGAMSARWAGNNNVYGVDFSPNMLLLARGNGLKVYHADAMTLPFVDGMFDVTMSVEVIQNIGDPATFLSEMARVTAAGGRVIVSSPNAQCVFRKGYRLAARLGIIGKDPDSLPTLRPYSVIMDLAGGLPLRLDRCGVTYFPFAANGPCGSPPGWRRYIASNYIFSFRRV